MATIKSALVLNDQMSMVLRAITGSMNTMLTSFEGVQNAADRSFNPSGLNQVRQGIGQANAMLDEMEEHYQKVAQQTEKGRQGQGEFNRKISEGTNLADKLTGKLTSMVGAYLGMQTVKKALDISDEMTLNRARIDLMNDGLQTTDQLMNMIFASAQNARGSYSDMVNVVAKFGNNAGDAFSGSKEVVRFANLVQKQMKIAGTSATEASNAMLQLSQALGSGVLRGDELNSIFEQAPNLIRTVADYMGVGIGQIRSMASEGKITASIVKNAMFSAADDIEEKFNKIPMTWGDLFTQAKNSAIMALDPVLKKLNVIANSDDAQKTLQGTMTAVSTLGIALAGLLGVASKVSGFIIDHWSLIAPIIGTVVAALAAYKTAQMLSTTVEWLSTAAKIANAIHTGAKTVMLQGEEVATEKATMAQLGLNAAMLKSPAFIIPAVILGVIVAVAALCSWIAKTTGVAQTGFGVFYGGIYVVGAAFKNFGLLVANIALGIWGAIGALCSNMMTAFRNAIGAIKGWFYGLLSTALNVIAGICESLNNLPFVEFDFSGISGKAAEYAQKAAEAAVAKGEYKDVGAAFSKGFGTFDAFSSGWASTAFANGAAKGDKLMGKFKDNFSFGSYDGVLGSALGNIAGNTGSIADNTGRAADALDKTTEELEWLRDIAEKEAINRFTTASVSIDMTGMTNQISNDMDLDGVITALTDDFVSSLQTAAEGVY